MIELTIFFDVSGRLHPALVHLPVGILLLASCFELLSGKRRFAALKPAIPPMMLWGMLSAAAACLSGLALSSNGEYEEEELTDPHQWSGISLTAISLILYILYKLRANSKAIKGFSLVLLALVFVTGHLGGSITHGSDFITAPFSGDEPDQATKPIPDIQQAFLYTDVVQPLFQSRCYSCHSSKKQKGKLRLDMPDLIIKGGESGKTVVTGKPEDSELVQRLLLPLDHDDHMPPKGKRQLTKEQIEVLHWWVSTGTDFKKKVSELAQTEKIRPVLLALQTGSTAEKEIPELPTTTVVRGDSGAISKLTDMGVTVLPVNRESNYLFANFVSARGNIDPLIDRLMVLNKQLISLKLDGATLTDSLLKKIGSFSSLRKLQISNTPVNDTGLKYLAGLKELRSLNLVGTKISAKGLVELKGLNQLKNIYLYQTSITPAERPELKKIFPEANLDFGNYSLPMLASDTTEVKLR